MIEEWTDQRNHGKMKVFLSIILIVISLFLIGGLFLYTQWDVFSAGSTEVIHEEPAFTSSYTRIDPDTAHTLMLESKTLIILDVRGCECNYDKAHIPNAIWDIYPEDYYNTSSDVLAYCGNGAISKEFCKKLVNHIYGNIYHLEGGLNAWAKAGYEMI